MMSCNIQLQNCVIIGLVDGLLPSLHQTITWTDADSMSIISVKTTLS